jgi:hypothetical protein
MLVLFLRGLQVAILLPYSHANIPGMRPSPREKHFGCPKPKGQVSEMPRGRPSMTDKNVRRVPFFGLLSWARKKGGEIPFSLALFFSLNDSFRILTKTISLFSLLQRRPGRGIPENQPLAFWHG